MYLETYPITVHVGKQWRKFADGSFENQDQNNLLTFLYIGKNDISLNHISSSFQSGIFAEDFSQARILIEKFRKNFVPDAIIIDIPLNKAEFENFHAFLNNKGLDSAFVIIYNEKNLDIPKIKYLKHQGLIDDVFNISSDDINYSSKISFLKKIKKHQYNLRVTDEKVQHDSDFGCKKCYFKRSLDITLSIIAILFLSPILLLVALVIKFESKGPVIYSSARAGRGFKVFKFYKFRTMEIDADKKVELLSHLNQYDECEGGPRFLKINNDPRVTKLGRILRKTSLDELPQLFNVLKGDMSLVGNRPLPLYEASTLTTNEFVERFMAPAGITGLWQIKKRGKENMSTEERISLDIDYARKANILFDLWIMAQTPSALFQRSNV
jgi:lipopolysaccharide/colanic/teichoic acid biosynthesis glycosyltransferase